MKDIEDYTINQLKELIEEQNIELKELRKDKKPYCRIHTEWLGYPMVRYEYYDVDDLTNELKKETESCRLTENLLSIQDGVIKRFELGSLFTRLKKAFKGEL